MLSTVPARLLEQAKIRPNAPAYHVKREGRWVATTWAEYVAETRRAARALIALNLEPGGSTCLLGFNRPEWCVFDYATMAIGGAPAGIYTTSSPDEIAFIVDHCEARVVLVENEAQWRKLESQLGRLPKLEGVVFMKGAFVAHEKTLSWEQFLALGDTVPDAEIDARVAALQPNQLATLIYTSGTTGVPKGVMLSHDNLAWTASQFQEVLTLVPDDCVLSYLPLSHIAEQLFTLHGPPTFGYQVYFAESIERLPDNLKEVRPHLFFGVPRIWEKFQSAIAAKLATATGLKKTLASAALAVGRRHAANRLMGRPSGLLLSVQHRLLDRLVLSKIRAAIGLDRARTCVSGAAPVGVDVLQFLANIGLVVLEVYGQSEDTGPSTITREGNIHIGTVGPAFPGAEVKIAQDGEILVRGRNVFLGYFKDPVATAQTLVDGWLQSGDLGAFDDAGMLRITGRKKELIITAGGKNIAPRLIESLLKEHPLIAEAVAIGDRRRFISVLLCLDPSIAAALSREGDEPHLSENVRREVQRIVEVVNERLSRVEQVRKFMILPRPLGIEHGELTPTLKVKRAKVASNWSREIEEMYADEKPLSS